MRLWPAPSLARRLVLALSGAFVLVWIALVSVDYLVFKKAIGQRLAQRSAAEGLGEALAQATPAEAALIARASELQFNRTRREAGLGELGALHFQVEDLAGHQVYPDTPLLTREAATLRPDDTVSIGPTRYWSAQHVTPRWRVVLLEPVVEDGTVLAWIGRDLLQPLLVAFPLVLLPMWLAVRQGLAPLRELVARIAGRHPAEVSALGLDMRYAELRPLVTAFDDLLGQARARIAREQAFLQDVAHELRTPLAVITAQAHAVAGAATREGQRSAKAALERAVARAAHLVHQLLTLARLESPAPAARQPAELVEVVRQVVIATAPVAEQQDIDVALVSDDRLPANVDVHALHSVLDNLLRNALAYCPSGSRVEVRLSQDAGRICLAVSDDGPGLPEADRQALFERFRRGRDAPAGGSGLGLSIVHEATRRLRGTLSTGPGIDGRGVTFSVCFPAVAVAAAAPEQGV